MEKPPKSPESPRRLRVFLCHSSGDKPAVRDLCRRLLADGFDPWLDEKELLPGQDWRDEIPKAVHDSDVVIVCLSRASVTKEGYLQKEVKYALDVAGEKPEGTIFIIPLKLEECDVPRRLSQWQWASLLEADGYERLTRALGKRADTIEAAVLPRLDASPLKDAQGLRQDRQGREFLKGPGQENQEGGLKDGREHADWRKTMKLASVGLLVLVALSSALRYFSQHGKTSRTSQERSAQGVTATPSGAAQLGLRSEKATLSRDQAKVMVVTHNFYRAGWNDSGKGVAHQYETKALHEALVVIDHSTALMWQKGGSGDHAQGGLQGAQDYVRGLNAGKFGGFDDWRLPTLEEAMSLMTTPEGGQPGEVVVGNEKQKGVYHIDREFEKNAAYFIWTADLESPGRGWVVYFWDGICDDKTLDFNGYVRAVRSLGSRSE